MHRSLVTGVLVLVAIVSLVILIAIRLRRQQAPLPDRVMPPVNRLSRRFGFEGWETKADNNQIAERPPSYRETVKHQNAAFESNEETVVGKNRLQRLYIYIYLCSYLR